jgi:hypothetical protein
MAGVWPDIDAQDMEDRIRFHVSEPVADFFTQAEILLNLDTAAKEIAQQASCLRDIVPAVSVPYVREIAAADMTVHHVEYLPEAGKGIFLPRITPLMIGHTSLQGRHPQGWYPLEGKVFIEPVPVEVFNFNFYISEMPEDLDGPTDQTDLTTPWQSLMVLMSTARALNKDRKYAPAQLLTAIAGHEIEYLRQNVVENIPDAADASKGKR